MDWAERVQEQLAMDWIERVKEQLRDVLCWVPSDWKGWKGERAASDGL